MSRHLFTTVPLREYVPQGHVPISRAMVCLDCPTIFFVGPTCPKCASEAMIPLQTWIDREPSA